MRMFVKKPGLYLSGAIEFADDAFGWRWKMERALQHLYNVIIPYSADPPHKKNERKYQYWVQETFIFPDLAHVSLCPEFFVKLDKGVFKGAGTTSELTMACWMRKNIVAFLDGITVDELPGWMLGCLADSLFVDSIDDAIEHYRKLG